MMFSRFCEQESMNSVLAFLQTCVEKSINVIDFFEDISICARIQTELAGFDQLLLRKFFDEPETIRNELYSVSYKLDYIQHYKKENQEELERLKLKLEEEVNIMDVMEKLWSENQAAWINILLVRSRTCLSLTHSNLRLVRRVIKNATRAINSKRLALLVRSRTVRTCLRVVIFLSQGVSDEDESDEDESDEDESDHPAKKCKTADE